MINGDLNVSAADATPVDIPEDAGSQSIERLDQLRHSKGPLSTADIRTTMQKTMQNHASVFRDGPVLQDGVEKMLAVTKSFKDVGIHDRSLTWYSWPPSYIYVNSCIVGILI